MTFDLVPGRSLLIVVDVQERFTAAIPAIAADQPCGRRIRQLVAGAALLGVRTLITEQYPKGLGPTLADIRALAPQAPVLPKSAFSAVEDPAIASWLAGCGVRTAVVCGIEAHVCVLSTIADLRALGWEVVVAADAVASRDPAAVPHALAAARDLSALAVPAESILLRWQREAGTPRFKELSALIR